MTRNADAAAPAPGDGGFSLRRWSRRKLDATRQADTASLPAVDSTPSAARPAAAAELPPLPSIESLTFDSDFSAFMQPHVAEHLKRQALRKLLHDPHFNVMDGLDVYIDDYSIPSPLESSLVAGMVQARYIFDPPPTRVNADGHVEDIPPEPAVLPAAEVVAATEGASAVHARPLDPAPLQDLPQIRSSPDCRADHAIDHDTDATDHPAQATR